MDAPVLAGVAVVGSSNRDDRVRLPHTSVVSTSKAKFGSFIFISIAMKVFAHLMAPSADDCDVRYWPIADMA